MHRVQGSGVDFYMDETPVNYTDYYTYVRAGGAKNAYWSYTSYNIPDQPVTGISWHDAVTYCNWRSSCENLEPVYTKTDSVDTWGYPIYHRNTEANGYRLPTSAEFEFAALAGQQLDYPWGNTFSDSLANYDNDRGHQTTAWWRLATVHSQFRNAFGLYNMCGNNWHWCDDWKTEGHTKYLKGGSWGTVEPKLLKSSLSSHSSPGNYNYDIGFRCVRTVIGVNDTIQVYDTLKPFLFERMRSDFVRIPPLNSCYDSLFTDRLAAFLSDNYPESIYFLQQVDSQNVITPFQLAEKLVSVCKKHRINPLFLTAIMISESGCGTVSFPRWYNNPMAYHWQNKLMVNGYPVYEAKPGKQNRKYARLEDGFHAFCKGIRRDLYYKGARKNLDSFHMIYVGYRADEWMNTLSRVYRDVGGWRLEATYPISDAGALIYTDWKTIKQSLKTQ